MTDLLFIRKKFVQLSGRYDLVSSVVRPNNLDHTSNDWTDRGANFFIQSGQRLLDRELPFHKSQAELTFTLATSDYLVYMSGNVRSVKEVVLQDSVDNEQLNLGKTTVRWLRWKYGADATTLASTDTDQPIYYAMGISRTVVSPTTTTAPTTEVRKLLVLQPPADQQYTLKVICELEGTLEADTDETFHSHQFPELLVYASMYHLELSLRNRTGALEWLETVVRMCSKLDDDLAEEESSDTEPLTTAWDFIADQVPSSQIVVS